MSGKFDKDPVAVAVSGGLDSLYSLLLLQESGVEVFALHARFLPPHLRHPKEEEGLERLKESARLLGVQLNVVDLSGVFEDKVIRPFVRDYLAGKTPNPCAHCNKAMKFGLLREEAARLGASRIATGHYAKLLDFPDGPALLAGDDASKDQSYFLALTPLASLACAVFPLGGHTKRAVAAELARRGLEAPCPEESQEICFIGNNDYRAFLRDDAGRSGYGLPGPGPVRLVGDGGVELGRHGGLWGYTQGQRHGLGIAWREPLYVLGKNIAENALVVGPNSAFTGESCLCDAPNCLTSPELWPEIVLAKTRYRQRLDQARAELCMVDGQQRLRLTFTDGQRRAPAAPGQVAALYAPTESGLRLLAGAEII